MEFRTCHHTVMVLSYFTDQLVGYSIEGFIPHSLKLIGLTFGLGLRLMGQFPISFLLHFTLLA